MNPYKLGSNDELRQFLLDLAKRVKSTDNSSLADKLTLAAESSTSSPSEYLGDARNALSLVIAKAGKALEKREIEEIDAVIEQINVAFREANGMLKG